MEVEEIRKTASNRPFSPFEIYLDNGKTYKVKHPEIIITETLIVTVDEEGKIVLIAPEAVSSIRILDKDK